VPGARSISIRACRIDPHLQTKMEKHVAGLLYSGMIQITHSPFSSLVLMVNKKEEGTWIMVTHYRHVNALTLKGKYPIPVIDELLDEVAGACWF
jgi:hypothetical protein